MVQPSTLPANSFVRVTRRVYNPLEFRKGYNFVLWFIFAGALFGFSLARFPYLDIPGVFCGPNYGPNHAAPGECYYYNNLDVAKIGIRLHLYAIIPAGLLVPFQFTPVIRHKIKLFHRINGYAIILLAVVGNVGAIMIARHAFGGTLATQTWVGFTVILTTFSLANALYNIKRLQIDQHRAWMLRTWFYFASIITVRLIMIIMAMVITSTGEYSFVQPCAKLANIFNDNTTLLQTLYPTCSSSVPGVLPTGSAIVSANMKGNAAEIATALNMCFGVSTWLATAIHAVGVEIYLHLTPRESDRLRNVSYQRQLEAGFTPAGDAGLTVQRIGDADPFRFKALDKAPLGSDAVLTSTHGDVVSEELGLVTKTTSE